MMDLYLDGWVGGDAGLHMDVDENCIIEQSYQKQLMFIQNLALVFVCRITVTHSLIGITTWLAMCGRSDSRPDQIFDRIQNLRPCLMSSARFQVG